jgi:hypothetical protein
VLLIPPATKTTVGSPAKEERLPAGHPQRRAGLDGLVDLGVGTDVSGVLAYADRLGLFFLRVAAQQLGPVRL